MSNTTTKYLTYKVARFNNEKINNDLQKLIETALKKKNKALTRRQRLEDQSKCRLINFHGPEKGLRVGEFFDYTVGHKQPQAELNEDNETLKISSLAAADKSEFLHSILYFGISGNNVVLSQSMSLKSLHFEEYLNWLLRECKLIGDEDFVILADHPPLNEKERIAKTTGIEFHAPVSFEPVGDPNSDNFKVKPGNTGWELIKDIVPKEMKLPSSIDPREVIQERSLEVTLMLSWKRNYKEDSTDFLDRLSNQLRHVDDEADYAIHTRSGKITKDELKLRKPASVRVNDDGLIRKSDMWIRMFDWIEELIKEQRIAPDL